MKYSKNFYWWILSLVCLIACVVAVIQDKWFVAVSMALFFGFSGAMYLEKRKAGQ